MRKGRLAMALLAMTPWLPSCQHSQRDGVIEVLSITREINTSVPGHEICHNFTLTMKDVESYFTAAKEVDGHAFHHEGMILPCKYQGSIRHHGNTLQWVIHAGGAGYLYDKGSVNKRYLCKEKCCDLILGLC